MNLLYEINSSESLASRLYKSGIPINVATDCEFTSYFTEDDSLGSEIIKVFNVSSTVHDKDVAYIFVENSNVNRGPSWISLFQKQLKSMRNLQNDWNGYGSSAPNSIAIRNSQTVLDILHILNFSPISIVPSAEDGIAISFAKGKKRAIIESYNDGNIAAAKYEIDGEPLVWNVGISEEDIKESINRIYDFIQ
jgi:hypothetical protein